MRVRGPPFRTPSTALPHPSGRPCAPLRAPFCTPWTDPAHPLDDLLHPLDRPSGALAHPTARRSRSPSPSSGSRGGQACPERRRRGVRFRSPLPGERMRFGSRFPRESVRVRFGSPLPSGERVRVRGSPASTRRPESAMMRSRTAVRGWNGESDPIPFHRRSPAAEKNSGRFPANECKFRARNVKVAAPRPLPDPLVAPSYTPVDRRETPP